MPLFIGLPIYRIKNEANVYLYQGITTFVPFYKMLGLKH